jgi:hypothetical protein
VRVPKGHSDLSSTVHLTSGLLPQASLGLLDGAIDTHCPCIISPELPYFLSKVL